MDELLEMFHMDTEIHADAIKHAWDKHFTKAECRLFFQPEFWDSVTQKILNKEFHLAPMYECYLDKKTGNRMTYKQAKARNFENVRKYYKSRKVDSVILNAIYQVFYRKFSYLIHPLCCSYKKGESTRKVVNRVARDFSEMMFYRGFKEDIVKFFDSVSLPVIDATTEYLDSLCPSAFRYLLDELFHDDRIIISEEALEDPDFVKNNKYEMFYDNELKKEVPMIRKFCSLKQGCAMAAFYADIVLRDVDEFMSTQPVTYYRYSDDCIIVGKGTSASKAKYKMSQMLKEKGLRFNPDKSEKINENTWVTFLGFKIKKDQITISGDTLKNVTHKIKEETVCRSKQLRRALTENELRRAIDNIQYWLFVGTKDTEAGMGAYLYGAINDMHDLGLIDTYAKDCIRAAATNKCDIYGLVPIRKEHGIMAGGNDKKGVFHPGRNVGMNKLKTEGLPERLGWYSLIHMYKKFHSGTDVYKAEVLRMRNGECFEGEKND